MAKEKSDPLALHLFHQAGFQLGKHVKALLPNAEPVCTDTKIVVICALFTLILWLIEPISSTWRSTHSCNWISVDQVLGSAQRR